MPKIKVKTLQLKRFSHQLKDTGLSSGYSLPSRIRSENNSKILLEHSRTVSRQPTAREKNIIGTSHLREILTADIQSLDSISLRPMTGAYGFKE